MTSACAPRTPAPTNRVTLRAALSASASARTCSGSGMTLPGPGTKLLVPVGCADRLAATSPGMTTTPTPPLPSAFWIAIRSTRGIWDGWLITSQ
jgi:hypothetical protein